jgi:uncharacterized protein
MKITAVEGEYSVYRFAANAPVPESALAIAGFINITRTSEELSIVCTTGMVHGAEKEEDGWSLWKVEGPLDFGMIGVLSSITAPLAVAGVSIFAASTFDTDYILWKRDKAGSAVRALRTAGFEVNVLNA